jgi:hypothetical protein
MPARTPIFRFQRKRSCMGRNAHNETEVTVGPGVVPLVLALILFVSVLAGIIPADALTDALVRALGASWVK